MSERLLLALDTSTTRGSVAVGVPGDALARAFLGRQGAHVADLIPAVHRTLAEAGVQMDELQGIVVGAGPGSFTGVRVAAATAKGMARALEVPLWAFSSLAAGAATPEAVSPETLGLMEPERSLPYAGGLEDLPRCVLFDARAERVYAACYRFGPAGPPEVLLPPCATDVRGAIGTMQAVGRGVAFAGDGAQRHQETIREAGFPVLPPPAGIPTADGLLYLMGLEPDAAPLEDPGRWEPDYVRAWTGGSR